MVTGNAKCLPTIFQVVYLWLNNILKFSFYSSLQLIHLRFTIHLIVPGTVKNLINNYTSLYLSLYRSQLLHASVSQQVSRNAVLGLVLRPPTLSRINSRPIDLCRKASKNVLFTRVQSGDTVATQLRAGSIPSHDNQSHKLNTSNLEICTFTMYRYVSYRNRNSFARVLNCYFIFSTCKFAYLSAELISDLGSN